MKDYDDMAKEFIGSEMNTFSSICYTYNKLTNLKILTYEPLLKEEKLLFNRKSDFYIIINKELIETNKSLSLVIEKKGKYLVKKGNERFLAIEDDVYKQLTFEFFCSNFDLAACISVKDIAPKIESILNKRPNMDFNMAAANAMTIFFKEKNLTYNVRPELNQSIGIHIAKYGKLPKECKNYLDDIKYQEMKQQEAEYREQKWWEEEKKYHEEHKYDYVEMTDDEKLSMGWDDEY